jgi:hypothetical protein
MSCDAEVILALRADSLLSTGGWVQNRYSRPAPKLLSMWDMVDTVFLINYYGSRAKGVAGSLLELETPEAR